MASYSGAIHFTGNKHIIQKSVTLVTYLYLATFQFTWPCLAAQNPMGSENKTTKDTKS